MEQISKNASICLNELLNSRP